MPAAGRRSPGPAAPGANVDAPRIQHERGFDRRGIAARARGLINAQDGRQTENFPIAKGANDPVFFDQKIHVILGGALAGEVGKAAS